MPTYVQDSTGLVAIKNEVVDFVSSDHWKDTLIEYGMNLAFAILILVIGWWTAKWSGKAVRKILTKSKTDAGLISFLSSLVVIVLKIFVVVTAISQLGVQMTSFITILGAAGLAIGMAFSGTLANFAGGVMILLFKPFKVGDTILTQTQQGKVTEIQIFYTYIFTSDNKVVVMPNGPLANGSIVNYTREKKRRVDWIIALANGDDYVKAHQLIATFLKEDKRVLVDPEPFIALSALHAEAISITVRAWTGTDDYWPVYYDLNQRVYQEFTNHGLHLATKVEDVKKTTK
jgi:small conductance mechanosensitive channel